MITIAIALSIFAAALAIANWVLELKLSIKLNKLDKFVSKFYENSNKIAKTQLDLFDNLHSEDKVLSEKLSSMEDDVAVHEDIIQCMCKCLIDLWRVNWFLPPKDDEDDEEIDWKAFEEGLSAIFGDIPHTDSSDAKPAKTKKKAKAKKTK